MTTQRVKRKLSAILSADVRGYSRLMSQDEEATVKTLKQHRETISGLILDHRGRVVDAPGDNILAEFGSVVDAVKCAVEIQQALNTKNAGLPEDRRMNFRIGVNLGDVIEEEDRIYGDGVNIAARLEGLAEGGGIYISGTAFDQVKNKLSVGYQYVGKQVVKNIPDPVRAYNVLMEPEAAGKVIGEEEPKPAKWGWKTVAAGILVLVVLAGGVVWNFYFRAPRIETASVEKMAYPLPDKPSIAVLPFVNLSEDPKQEYFTDGMTDDLITDLSKISGLFVIARNSAFTYKKKSVKIGQVAEELGVRYVLEGSVRKVDNRVRINAQLIDATTGGHLWAERYDGNLGDIFALQDRIREKIVAAIAVKMTAGEQEQIARRYTKSVAAYDAFLQGRAHYVRRTPEDFVKAVHYYEKAIELDPDYGRAYAALALTYWESQHHFWNQSLDVSWYGARFRAEKYLQTATKNPTALSHQVASKLHVDQHEHEEAIAEAQRAIALDANDSDSYLAMAYALIHFGKPEEALDFVEKAMRLDPYYPAYYLFVLGLAHFSMERFEEAATLFERALKRNPIDYVPLIHLAAAYGHLVRGQEAAAAVTELNKAHPGISLGFMGAPFMLKYKHRVDNDRLLDGLRRAGLP